MARHDWLVGVDRRAEAAERILAAASEMVSRGGFETFSINALATEVHCSPATIYRNVGGKSVILEAVMRRMSVQIIDQVLEEITGLEGAERIVTAVTVGLSRIRAEPLGRLIIGSVGPGASSDLLTSSPLVIRVAEQIIGRSDPAAAQWLIRATFALWLWPVRGPDAERAIVEQYIGPCLASHASGSP